MFTADKARQAEQTDWDQRIRSAVERSSNRSAYLLIMRDRRQGIAHAKAALVQRGFTVTDVIEHDYESDQVHFNWIED